MRGADKTAHLLHVLTCEKARRYVFKDYIAMIRFLFSLAACAWATTSTAEPPHTFNNSSIANAEHVNENFADLDTRLESLEASVFADGFSRDTRSQGWPKVNIDCSSSPGALANEWQQITTFERVLLRITGSCNEPAGGMVLIGQKVALTGNNRDDNSGYGTCNTSGTILDDGDGSISLQLSNNSSLQLECIQLGVDEPATISTYHSDLLRFYEGVSTGSDNLSVNIQNGGFFRTFSWPQAIASLSVSTGSTALIRGHVDLSTVAVEHNSTFISEGAGYLNEDRPGGGTITSMSARWGSQIHFRDFAHNITVGSLVGGESSLIFEKTYSSSCPRVQIDSEALASDSKLYTELQGFCTP